MVCLVIQTVLDREIHIVYTSLHRESVDSLCRDDTDAPIAKYILKASKLSNAWILRLFRYIQCSLLCFWNGLLSLKYPSITKMARQYMYGNHDSRHLLLLLQMAYSSTGRSTDHDSLTKLIQSPMHRAFSQNQRGI